MARMPGATWLPVQNHGGPMGSILGVVIHVQEGNNSLQGWFNNPASQASSHFWVSKAGALEQYVDAQVQTAWAQGAGNANYLSVETEGYTTEALTTAQISGFARIMTWAAQTYGVPLVLTNTPGARGLITHGAGGVAWGNHPGCPGTIRAGQRQQILDQASGGQPPPTTEAEVLLANPAGGGYYVVKGDGSVYSFGNCVYRGGINWVNWPTEPMVNALIPGDVCTGAAWCATGGYWLSTAGGYVYSFGGAPWLGNAT